MKCVTAILLLIAVLALPAGTAAQTVLRPIDDAWGTIQWPGSPYTGPSRAEYLSVAGWSRSALLFDRAQIPATYSRAVHQLYVLPGHEDRLFVSAYGTSSSQISNGDWQDRYDDPLGASALGVRLSHLLQQSGISNNLRFAFSRNTQYPVPAMYFDTPVETEIIPRNGGCPFQIEDVKYVPAEATSSARKQLFGSDSLSDRGRSRPRLCARNLRSERMDHAYDRRREHHL
ncbi:MAG: hypothetical protein IPG61_19275 [bacterium]|nr:hypothetical protein [bacterium]